MWNLWHIYDLVKTKMQADFLICISAPLNYELQTQMEVQLKAYLLTYSP